MKKTWIWTVLIGAATAIWMPAQSETRIGDNLKFFKLKNGVSVLIYPRHSAPMFAGMLYVNAGSAEEQVGETGLAHLLEHMAFKGTPWIGTRDWAKERPIQLEIEKVGEALNKAKQKTVVDEKEVESLQQKLSELQKAAAEYIIPNEYDQIITRAGGQETNATTDVDYTNYFMTVPSNKLELWAMMESQRMVYPAWREFYQERDVVAEERRMRSEDTPTGKLYEEFIASAFHAHPYRNPTIGWMPDIYNLTIRKTDEFYKKWYVPENLIICLVGDVNPDEAKATLEKYFGTIPSKPSPPKAITTEAPQPGTRRTEVQYDAQPQILMGWHKPTYPDKDFYVFEVIQYLLTRSGRSSRLYTRLIKQDAICQDVETWTGPGEKYPNLFQVFLTPKAPHSTAEVEKVTLAEIERVKNEPVSEAELQKIRNQIDADFIKELETNLGFSKKLGYYYIITGDPNIIDNLRDEMKKVTAQDIQRVAQKYLTAKNLTTAELVPESVEAKQPDEDSTTSQTAEGAQK